MSCEACKQRQKEIQKALNTARSKAKAYAIENQKNVVIYQENAEWFFMEAEAARAAGITPTGGMVSFLQPASF
jgi:hypothetical protein